MSGLEEISVELRDGGHTERGYEVENGLPRGEQNLQDSSGLGSAGKNATLTVGETGDGTLGGQPVDGDPEIIGRSTQEDHRARFYEHYHEKAEDYDKEFMKRYDQELGTTVIYGGLFSILTSVFITQIQSQLQSDPNEETASLLRVLIYKIDNTTFGGDVPAIPQWTGPSRAIIQVQCVLYASLTASLLSTFLAMLGQRWVNHYASMDKRGSVIERCQNRQQKLDAIARWYFNHVLESLPLMLQSALLLLGCALSRYLWEIDITLASVVLGTTSFGILVYLFIVVAGVTSDICPYQVPATSVIRRVPGLFHPTYTRFAKHSEVYGSSVAWWTGVSRLPTVKVIRNTLAYPFVLLIALAVDFASIAQATFRSLVGFARSRPFGTHPVPNQVFGHQATATGLDFRCSFWMLQTSSDKATKVPTLNFLGEILSIAGVNSTINSAVVLDCFDIFSSCFVTRDGGVAIVTRGSEQLAGISAMCFLRAFSSLSITEPTSIVIRDVRQRYEREFPSRVDLRGLPCPAVISAIHHLFVGPRDRTDINWRDYTPTTDELIPFSRALAQAAQVEYHKGGDQPKVPQWLIRFALHFLSQCPLPPTSVVVDCLLIVATDLGCTLPDNNRMAIEERAWLEHLFTSIIQRYETIASSNQHIPESMGDATIAFLPYASRQEENGVGKLSDVLFCTAKFSPPSSRIPHWTFKLARYLETVLPISLKRAAVDAFRHSHSLLEHSSNIGAIMQRWIEAASMLPYTDDVGESVVDTLLQMAFRDGLRRHIPVEAWGWLKKRPILHPKCQGLKFGASPEVFQSVREVGDLELVTSYLFIVWSKWGWSYPEGSIAVLEFIRSGLRGVEGAGYRADLIQRLDDVISQMHSDSSTSPEVAGYIALYTEFKTALEGANE